MKFNYHGLNVSIDNNLITINGIYNGRYKSHRTWSPDWRAIPLYRIPELISSFSGINNTYHDKIEFVAILNDLMQTIIDKDNNYLFYFLGHDV